MYAIVWKIRKVGYYFIIELGQTDYVQLVHISAWREEYVVV